MLVVLFGTLFFLMMLETMLKVRESLPDWLSIDLLVSLIALESESSGVIVSFTTMLLRI